MEELLRIIVPLGIFAFWALTKLSEKGVKPLEARNPPGAANPPRSSLEALLRQQQEQQGRPQPRPAPPADRAATMRWANQVSGPKQSTREDEIIILSDARTPPPPRPAPRKGARARAAARPTAQAQQPAPRSRGLADVNQQVAQELRETLTLTPLNVVSQSLASASASAASAQAMGPVESSISASVAQLRTNLKDPQKIREAIILNEILQPPLALRRGRR